MVEVWLPYGSVEVCARIPSRNFLGSIDTNDIQPVSDPKSEITRALKNPLGTDKLSEIVNSNRKTSILIDTRDHNFLENEKISPILDELRKAGADHSDITIIIAGNNRSETDQMKLTDILGENSMKEIKIRTLSFKSSKFEYAGTSSSGTEISLDRDFIDSDTKIIVGRIDYDSFIGYGGGTKSILLGVSNEKTVKECYSRILRLKDASSQIENDMIREDADEAAKLGGLDFSLNIVTNSKNDLVSAFAGDFDKAFKKCTKVVDKIYRVPVELKTDILLVSPGGNHYDSDLQKSCKAINRYLEIVKKGGVIVLAAECINGLGEEAFYDWTVNAKDLREIKKNLMKNFVFGGYVAYILKKAFQRVHVVLVSILPDQIVKAFNLKCAKSINDGLRIAFDTVGDRAKVMVLPRGNTVFPYIKR